MSGQIFIKICGLTRAQDIACAVAAGAHAVGFVLYPKSPRAVVAAQAARLSCSLPPHVQPVLLLVNPSAQEVAQAMQAVPRAWLQFHGDETPEQCQVLAGVVPFWRAARIPTASSAQFDLVKYQHAFQAASALLLDSLVTGYGGSGKTFQWQAIQDQHPLLSPPLVLSGGLTPANVGEGIRILRPWGVDVSSGVELAPGIKAPQKIVEFVQAVQRADLNLVA